MDMEKEGNVLRSRILVVEDEEDLLELVTYNLAREGFRVESVTSGEAALQAAQTLPDLVLLDLMLPGVDGLEVCRRLRSDTKTRELPIIMLTAKGEESDIVAGLELGADDYIPKPFSPRVLLARIRSALRSRRGGFAEPTKPIRVHGVDIDPRRRVVEVNGSHIALTYSEFNVLHLLARRPGWVFTRQQIVDAARGEDADVTERAVDVHIVNLRRKLRVAGDVIHTVRGVGYRIKD